MVNGPRFGGAFWGASGMAHKAKDDAE